MKKKLFVSKMAGFLATMMVISMLLPVVAFAEFANVKNVDGTVTGEVYVTDTVYEELEGTPGITLWVYEDGVGDFNVPTVATYTYKNGEGQYYFQFEYDASSHAKENTLTFSYLDPTDPTNSTYVESSPVSYYQTPTNPPIFGGGGGFPPATDKVEVIDSAKLTNLFNANADATLEVTSEVVSLNAEGLAKGQSLTLTLADGTSITLPIAALDLAELAESLGVELKDLQIQVEMKKLTGDSLKELTDAAAASGAELLSNAVDFNLYAVANDEKQEIKNFGDVYVNRTLAVNSSVTESTYDQTTGALYDPTTKEFSFVPSTFAESDGKTIATLKRNSLSIYTVVQVDAASFEDTATHWAKDDISTLASKLIAEGKGDNLFAPEHDIKRAEFAALVVRSLGLDAVGTTSAFDDVASDKWYAGAVAAAVDAKLIEGYNGAFRPEAKITRSEVAAIVVRALAFAGKEVVLTEEEITSALADYSDASTLDWAREEVAAALSTGIVKGKSDTVLDGSSNASRAEAATMITRFLTNAEFIN